MQLFAFFQEGGPLMAIIALIALASLYYLLKAMMIAHASSGDGRGEELFQANIKLARSLTAVALGVAGIGMFSGALSAMIAVAQADVTLRAAAAAPGVGQTVNTGLWGLLVATPLYLAAAMIMYRRTVSRTARYSTL
jgi:hypothetical protein